MDEEETKKPEKKEAAKDNDFDFLENDVDFPDDGNEEENKEIDTQDLINADNVNVLNELIKGSQYLRKNKLNLEMFNKFDQYSALFEEFTQNGEMFVFSEDIGEEVYQLSLKIDNEEEFGQRAQVIFQAMKEEYGAALNSEDYDR